MTQASPRKAKKEESPKVIGWIEYRLPIFSFFRKELVDYQTPRNLNFMWNFGFLAGIILLVMILTGMVLAMHYTPHVDHAFESVERLMRDVNYGWLLRYIHMNGASMLFIVVYLHIFRGLYYGSYKNPRELLWITGVLIFLIMMAIAFTGYVLPWSQMGYWGAVVITDLFSAIPFVGDGIVEWIRGGFSVANPTLNRFFSLHYFLPFLLIGIIVLHLAALHQHGSNNPYGIDASTKEDTISFHPYYTVKDFFSLGVLLLFWAGFVFFAPHFFGEPDHYTPADPLVTPPHIVPEWYFLPFYAILKSVPSKLGGVTLMFSAVLILFAVPWLDRSPVRSGRFRPFYRLFFAGFAFSCLLLGWVGTQSPEGVPLFCGRLATAYYFFFFFVVMPFLPRVEKTKELPQSIAHPNFHRRSGDRLEKPRAQSVRKQSFPEKS